MSSNNIIIDYEKVSDTVSNVKKIAATDMVATADDFTTAVSHMTTAKGKTYESIKKQMDAEKKLVKKMAVVMRKFAAGINTAASSFKNVDNYMKNEMKEGEH